MGLTKSLDKEIVYYLKYLTTEQKKAVLGIVKCFARIEFERRSVKHTGGKAKEIRLIDEHLEILDERRARHLNKKDKSSSRKDV